MRNYISFLFFIVSLNLFSQTTFDKGYYITNNGDTIHCLIKNLDWLNNPNTFHYKLDPTSEAQSTNISEVKLFEIYNSVKFIRAKVKVDLSETNVQYLSKNKQPELIEKELFLKEIVSGEANLYEYHQNLIYKFFYKNSQKGIEPLIYKEYRIDGDKIGKNLSYQQELYTNLVCDAITLNQIKKVKYNAQDLTNLFVKYNSCKNPEQKIVPINSKENNFNFTFRPRINFSKLKNDLYNNKTQVSLGFEIEYTFPMNHKKWSVFIDPNYVGYKKNEKIGDIDIHLKFRAIEVPVGVRYAVALSNKSKLYLNAAFIFDLNFGSSLKIERKIIRYNVSEDLKTDHGFAFGLGYKFKDRYSIEARTTTTRNHTLGDYNNTSIILGYRIF